MDTFFVLFYFHWWTSTYIAACKQEVRNLTQRAAANQTSDLIEKSQHSATNGSELAVEMKKNLRDIEESSSKVSTLIAEISGASSEQANTNIKYY